MGLQKTAKNLEKNGFAVSLFETAAEAANYLNSEIDGKTVGFGGSITLEEMNLYDSLSPHNTVYWHWRTNEQNDADQLRTVAATTDIYLTSVNGLAKTGELINIDGTGNRLASTIFGHKKIYFIVGVNKIEATYDKALWRARNIAAPKNAQRLKRKTPCAKDADRCHDCSSPERICRALTVIWRKMSSCEMEVVLINEKLGY